MKEIIIVDLIKNGLLQLATDLYKIKTGEKLGRINENGTITIDSNGVGKNYEYPILAARCIEKICINA